MSSEVWFKLWHNPGKVPFLNKYFSAPLGHSFEYDVVLTMVVKVIFRGFGAGPQEKEKNLANYAPSMYIDRRFLLHQVYKDVLICLNKQMIHLNSFLVPSLAESRNSNIEGTLLKRRYSSEKPALSTPSHAMA